MTREEFAKLLGDFTHSAESGDGARFAQHFAVEIHNQRARHNPHHDTVDPSTDVGRAIGA